MLTNTASAAGALAGGIARALPTLSLRRSPYLVRGLLESSNAYGIKSWSPQARDNYVQMMTYYDTHGLPVGDLTQLPALLDRTPTSYTEFARREVDRRANR